jgi:dTMP kinase
MPSGAKLVVTREPGGTALGAEIRKLLLHPLNVPTPTTELLLFTADRAQHVETIIKPALAAGDWVLCDRYTGSTVAYQGYGRGIDLGLIASLEQVATSGLKPDLTLWLYLSVEESLARRKTKTNDHIESAGEAFLKRVAAGFADIACKNWHLIDAHQTANAVLSDCQKTIQLYFPHQ